MHTAGLIPVWQTAHRLPNGTARGCPRERGLTARPGGPSTDRDDGDEPDDDEPDVGLGHIHREEDVAVLRRVLLVAAQGGGMRCESRAEYKECYERMHG
jgi:hypothetical protein